MRNNIVRISCNDGEINSIQCPGVECEEILSLEDDYSGGNIMQDITCPKCGITTTFMIRSHRRR